MFVVNAILHALQISLSMVWEVLWPLALGFLLSAMVQTVVSKRAVDGTVEEASRFEPERASGLPTECQHRTSQTVT